jgi:hypothetical protein
MRKGRWALPVAPSAPLISAPAARQAHREYRTFTWLARHGHVATHHARELARDGKTKAGPAKLLRGRGIGLGDARGADDGVRESIS